MKRPALTIDALRDASARLPDNRLAPLRSAALEQLGRQGLPTLRDEDWKYTDLAPIVAVSNDWLAAGAGSEGSGSLDPVIDEVRQAIDADWIVIANGTLQLPAADGFELRLLSDTDTPLASPTPLAQLNAVLLADGVRITVAAGTHPARPIGVLVTDDASAPQAVSSSRVEIELGAGSRADIVEYQASGGAGRHYANGVVDLHVGDDAEASYVRIQDRQRGHSLTARLTVRLGRDSRFRHGGYDFGGALVRNDLDIDIGSPGAAAEFDGVYLAGAGQHVDNHTRIDHRVGPAVSRQEYRGILTGNAHCVWNGKAIVHAGADGTDAAQANHNLLLSDQAEIDAKPELEIYADEVKCSHGTTVGQLDETALYYLRTRGLDRRLAQRILTYAFGRGIIDVAPVEAAREALAQLFDARIESLLEDID